MRAAITPDFLKIPEPITPPTTIMIVVNNPSVGTRPALAEVAEGRFSGVVVCWLVGIQSAGAYLRPAARFNA